MVKAKPRVEQNQIWINAIGEKSLAEFLLIDVSYILIKQVRSSQTLFHILWLFIYIQVTYQLFMCSFLDKVKVLNVNVNG